MGAFETVWGRYRSFAPGILLSVAVAAVAAALQQVPGMYFLSPLIIAAVLGMAWRSAVGVPDRAWVGIQFAAKGLLRAAIVLLGLQISLGHIIETGWVGFMVAGIAVVSTFFFTIWFGRLIGADSAMVELLAAGTAVCGASAIVATNTVTRARDEDVTYALGSITFFGTLAVLVYPVLLVLLDLSPGQYGLWVGASIHEVAQVVAAGFQGGSEAGHVATIVKLIRVLLLAPLLLLLAWSKKAPGTDGRSAGRQGIPVFVLGFLAVVVANSMLGLPEEATKAAGFVTLAMLTISLAAIGLLTSVGNVLARGMKPLAVAAGSTLFIAAACLILSLSVGVL